MSVFCESLPTGKHTVRVNVEMEIDYYPEAASTIDAAGFALLEERVKGLLFRSIFVAHASGQRRTLGGWVKVVRVTSDG